ncbi:TPA: EAL domain-containing protein [Enterobacter cloacae]|uniref:EAL domain-containing protein n=1 Tax=Enterobacter chuandaensis TaxID=2497875 RepID=UPI0037761831
MDKHKNLLITIIVFLALTGMGSAFILWFVSDSMEDEMQARLGRALYRMDGALSHASLAAQKSDDLAGKPCSEELVLSLRRIVTTIPDVRTVNLVTGNSIYCTSLYGPTNYHLSDQKYFRGNLQLLSGNQVTPSRSLLVYRVNKNSQSILVGIDGYYLENALALLSIPTPLYLKIGDVWMGEDGQLHRTSPGWTNRTRVSTSEVYGIQVFTSRPSLLDWEVIWNYARGGPLIVIILSFILSALLYRLLNRHSTPVALLASAINQGEFEPWLQHIVDSKTLNIVGCEALVRWNHPTMGIIPPDQFIPLAETSGLITRITEQMSGQVSDFIKNNKDVLPEPFYCHINVSASDFQNHDINAMCLRFIERVNNPGIVLVLEITERDHIDDDSVTIGICHQLQQAGVIIAIDDFGTGNANLAYLKRFSAGIVKIDKMFITSIEEDAFSVHIVKNLIQLSTLLGFKTIAEGVETEKQAEQLSALGVTYMQGYLFGRPLPLSEYRKALANAKKCMHSKGKG